MNDEVSKQTSHNELYPTYRNSIVELFNSAESHDIAQFFLSLMPPPRELAIPSGGMLWEVPDIEIEEAFETRRYLDDTARNEQLNANIKTRLMLFISFHLLEADRWHSILGNVLNVIIGRNYVGNLFEEDALGEKINGIRGLLRVCQKANVVLSIRKTYSDICNDNIRELRNAFFHSHCTLSPKGDLLIIKRVIESPQGFRNYYKFDEVREVPRRTVTFLTAFAEVRKERLGLFKDRDIGLDHEVDWIEAIRKPIAKRCETHYRSRGRFRYRQDAKRWRFQGLLDNVGDK